MKILTTSRESAERCLTDCLENSECQFWTFDKQTNNCSLKKGDEEEGKHRSTKDGIVSGSKFCPSYFLGTTQGSGHAGLEKIWEGKISIGKKMIISKKNYFKFFFYSSLI